MVDFDVTPEKRATKLAFLKRQMFSKLPKVSTTDVDLTGKTVIVTGSNTGIGYECSRQLLDLGLSKLILAVRSESKGEEAKTTLLRGRNEGKHSVEVWAIDLSSYDSITSFIERAKGLERLDIVIQNAGVSKANFAVIEGTGHEEAIQINYLSVALLTSLILPILKEKNTPQQPGRLVLVNSETASWASFREKSSVPLFASLDKNDTFDIMEQYATSKLLCQFFIMELTKRVPASVAIINAPNPGLCKSDLYREYKGTFIGAFFFIFLQLVSHSPAVGARSLIDAAVNHGIQSHGQYIEDGKIQPMAPMVYSPDSGDIAKTVWEETMKELEFAKVRDVIDSLKV